MNRKDRPPSKAFFFGKRIWCDKASAWDREWFWVGAFIMPGIIQEMQATARGSKQNKKERDPHQGSG